MSHEEIRQALGIVLNNLMVGMIYLAEYDNTVDFVYVSLGELEEDLLQKVEQELCAELHQDIRLIDIRTFDALTLLKIVRHTPVIYQESEQLDLYVSYIVAKAVKQNMQTRQAMLERRKEIGGFYLQ